MIYVDYAATTPVDPRVAKKMSAYLTTEGVFANPASTHAMGKVAKTAVEEARNHVANLFSAESSEIIWTSGATEADNLALKGAAQLYQQKGKHIITLKTEHQAVLDTCQYLEKNGFSVTYLTPETNGLLDVEKLKSALRQDTILVSIMQVNNEIGVIQDIKKIAELTSQRNILLHVDAAQSAGKISLNVQDIPVDLISCCAHKIYGPKGVGALYVRKKPRVRVAAQMHGGGQEQGMRSGTLATHQIVGMGEAFRIAQLEMTADYKKMQFLRDRFVAGLKANSKIKINIPLAITIPTILNLRIENLPAEKLLQSLPDVAFSKGSACDSKGVEASYVLRALGFSEKDANCSVRVSFGRFTTENEIDEVVLKILSCVGNPR